MRLVRRRGSPEHIEAVCLFKMVLLHEARIPDLRWLFAVPNGGDRHPAVAAKMKAEGVRPGVLDYLLPVRRGPHPGLAIELKSLTGSTSREQKLWIEHLRSQGWRVEVCRGWVAAWNVLSEYLGVMDARNAG